MKKLLLLATAVVSITIANAQTGKTSFGLKAGVNFQNLNGKDLDGDKMNNKIKTGFVAGVNAQIPIATDFYIQPGVEYAMKGAKTDDGVRININYIDVPVSLVYKPMLGSGNLILGFGPYVGFGIGGKVEDTDGEESDVKFKKEVTISELSSGTTYFKPMDAGANIFAGYEMRKLSFQLFTQLGLTKVLPKIQGFDEGNSSLKNTGFGLAVGYRL